MNNQTINFEKVYGSYVQGQLPLGMEVVAGEDEVGTIVHSVDLIVNGASANYVRYILDDGFGVLSFMDHAE